MDIFISHEHSDMSTAARLEHGLSKEGFSVWLDRNEVAAGEPLTPEIMAALNGCRNIVVLWSSAASLSNWVQLEWTTVLNLNLQKDTVQKKGIIACRLDETPFQPSGTFLVNYPYYDLHSSYDAGLRELVKRLRLQPPETPHLEKYEPPAMVDEIMSGQATVLAALAAGDVPQAKRLQNRLDGTVKKALEDLPTDRYVLTLDGYNRKNKYMIRHWDDIQAGQAPKDALLDQAGQSFLRVLSSCPDDPSALNGIGSVLMLRGDLTGAEFYINRAVTRSKEEHLEYGAAEDDLALVRRLKAAKFRS